jgi:hypothetical protein
MRCNNCGESFSDTVFPLHIQRCRPEPPVENGTVIVPELPVLDEPVSKDDDAKRPEPPVENAGDLKKPGKRK